MIIGSKRASDLTLKLLSFVFDASNLARSETIIVVTVISGSYSGGMNRPPANREPS